MLESRLIAGNEELFKTYSETMEKNLNLKKFYRAKFIEQQQRHLKSTTSPLMLWSRTLKKAPGGLRDSNILIWVLRAAHLGNTWQEVFEKGLITRRECELLESVTKSLYRLRIHMHLLTNRHEDRLIFEIQEPLAKALGIVGTVGRRPSDDAALLRQCKPSASSTPSFFRLLKSANLKSPNKPVNPFAAVLCVRATCSALSLPTSS